MTLRPTCGRANLFCVRCCGCGGDWPFDTAAQASSYRRLHATACPGPITEYEAPAWPAPPEVTRLAGRMSAIADEIEAMPDISDGQQALVNALRWEADQIGAGD